MHPEKKDWFGRDPEKEVTCWGGRPTVTRGPELSVVRARWASLYTGVGRTLAARPPAEPAAVGRAPLGAASRRDRALSFLCPPGQTGGRGAP